MMMIVFTVHTVLVMQISRLLNVAVMQIQMSPAPGRDTTLLEEKHIYGCAAYVSPLTSCSSINSPLLLIQFSPAAFSVFLRSSALKEMFLA